MKATTVAALALAAGTTFAHPIAKEYQIASRDITSDLSDLEARKVNWKKVGQGAETAGKIGLDVLKFLKRADDDEAYLAARDLNDLEARKVNWKKVGHGAETAGKIGLDVLKFLKRADDDAVYLEARDSNDLEARRHVNWHKVGKAVDTASDIYNNLSQRDELNDLEARKVNWKKVGHGAETSGKIGLDILKFLKRAEEGDLNDLDW